MPQDIPRILPGLPQLTPAQKSCVDLLKQILESAKKGEVNSCAIVACGPGGFGAAFAGPDAPQMYLGLASAQKAILDAVNNPNQRSPIITPGRR